MFLQSRIVFILSLVCTLVCSVVAMKCDKLLTIDDDVVTDHVFNEGVYRVKTTLQSNSGEIQELVGSLKNIDNAIFSRRSFTATLQPKHIKKVSIIANELSIYCHIYISHSYAEMTELYVSNK